MGRTTKRVENIFFSDDSDDMSEMKNFSPPKHRKENLCVCCDEDEAMSSLGD